MKEHATGLQEKWCCHAIASDRVCCTLLALHSFVSRDYLQHKTTSYLHSAWTLINSK
jgi:hypothetical protein